MEKSIESYKKSCAVKKKGNDQKWTTEKHV